MIKVGNGASVAASAIGTALVKLLYDHTLGLKDYLLLLNELKYIVSMSLLVKEVDEFFFRNNMCQIYYHNKLVCIASLVNGL